MNPKVEQKPGTRPGRDPFPHAAPGELCPADPARCPGREPSAAFGFSPQVVAQADGSFLVKPGKPVAGRKQVTVEQAAARARVSKDTIRRLYDSGFLEGARPSPRKTMIFADSLEAHLHAVGDRDYWESAPRRAPHRKKEMSRPAAPRADCRLRRAGNSRPRKPGPRHRCRKS